MKPVTPLRRHPWLSLAGLALAGSLLWIGYFLATFDLDRYRDRMADELGNQLRMPVHLGAAHLEMREAGIALRFDDLRIGAQQTRIELHAEKLWLQLAWHGLLLGKPILTEVALDTPRLRISPPEAAPPTDAAPGQAFQLETLRDFQVRRIEIHQGSLDFGWRYAAGTERFLALHDVNVEIADLEPGGTGVFDATGSLLGKQTPMRLACKGSIDLPAAGTLRDISWDLLVETKELDVAQVAALLPDQSGISAGGEGKLTLLSKGNLKNGVSWQTDLTGRNLYFRTGTAPQRVVLFNQLHFAGNWRQDGKVHHYRQLAVRLDDLQLSGEFAIQADEGGYRADVALGDSTLPLAALRHWLPAKLPESGFSLERLRPEGIATLQHAAFHLRLPASGEQPATMAFDSLRGRLTDLGWSISKTRTARLASLDLSLENGQWRFSHGAATIAGLAVGFSGTLTRQEDAPAQLAFDLTGKGSAAELATLWPKPLPAELALTGEVKFKGRISGTPEQIAVESHGDISALDVRYGDKLQLPPTPGAALTAQGQIANSVLTIDRAELGCPPLTGQLRGTFDWTGTPQVQLTGRLDLPELAAARDLIPALGKLQPDGGAALEMTVSGPVETPLVQTSLELRDIRIPTRGVVADISRLNGRLLLEGQGVRSDKLTARLGKSPVILQARIADLQAPRLELGVKAAAIRADEVIFHSDRSMLRDISGQLLIDGDGIAFAPVNVRLDGGTRAAVRGVVRDFSNPRVDLDITGDYANIEEIVGLWTDESQAARALRHVQPKADPAKFPAIRIQATARQGDLYGMKFHNATALIVPTAGQLLIHPLDFSIGEGYCNAQVLVAFSGHEPLLRVSGHAENVDAYEVVNELLDRKSIMRGSLRGDFYLQGALGKGKFLPTSFGNINVTVRDGVMRHSPVLSTVFSLLNVSQLFSFKLPDVNREGVPFTRVAAELAINKGVMSSDLVVMDSEAMNMSYVGKFDMVKDALDLLVVVKPLGTIDKVVTSLPIAGWILGGEERALITAQFKVTGPATAPEIEAIPISAMSRGILGIFQRTLSLPLKLVEDPAILWGGGGEKR